MCFDEIFSASQIEYGIINGNETVLYIKAGLGGGIFGYENKYLRIANAIHAASGCTVVAASNPIGVSTKTNIQADMNVISEKFPKIDRIFSFGHSNGGQMLLMHAFEYPLIKRVVAVNAPLMFELHRTLDGIRSFSGDKIIMVFGDQDQSYKYLEILDPYVNDNFEYVIIENANHHFQDKLEEFINLPMRFFL